MGSTPKTLRHEVFVSDGRTGPWVSLDVLKEAVESYINENELSEHVINLSETIYAWARGEAEGVSRAFVTVWFRFPKGQENPARSDSWKIKSEPENQ